MYRVLARKYRPTNFDDLIGQEVLVRTLTNAFASGRIAHAFILTGIRGIGKTTTARIIARGLNCIGPDGQGGPTTQPCGVCPNCTMIAQDRHVDVIEMDAASRTGVDDIRDIIESVQYAPTSGRYKIYIIDEVHMLSKNAFNALLKTLEEPPPHVKFIFATTEIRKIPVTIISRCQRFDLRRVDTGTLAEHLVNVSAKEAITLNEECAQLIATAAEGSVRDALSMLDQAIAMHTDAENITTITADSVRGMLGLADKSQLFTLLSAIVDGQAEAALMQAKSLHAQGADALAMVNDLTELVHYLTRIAVAPSLAQDVHYSATEQSRAKDMVAHVSVPMLSRMWQVLLKAMDEVRNSATSFAALEMVLIRLCYASSLPTPGALIAQLQNGALPPASNVTTLPVRSAPMSPALLRTEAIATEGSAARVIATEPVAQLHSYPEVVALFAQHREPILHAHLVNDVRVAHMAMGVLELSPISYLAPDIPVRIQRRLNEWTGTRWRVSFVEKSGGKSLAEQAQEAKAHAIAEALTHPNAQAFLQRFPDAKIIDFIPNQLH